MCVSCVFEVALVFSSLHYSEYSKSNVNLMRAYLQAVYSSWSLTIRAEENPAALKKVKRLVHEAWRCAWPYSGNNCAQQLCRNAFF